LPPLKKPSIIFRQVSPGNSCTKNIKINNFLTLIFINFLPNC
jgi:hypothetical protein